MSKLLVVEKVSKNFKEKVVLDNVNFQVEEGEIFCILGPNGAGKSTTINILTAALKCDQGKILFRGKRIGEQWKVYKKSIGIVPQDISLYEELSAETNLSFFASLYGLKGEKRKRAVEEALEFAGLTERRKDKVKTFSGGMKRRLNIACAISHKPQLVIMDEPTVGIDPQSRNHILESIIQLKNQGMTVIYTTHYMEEVETISNRIMIMDHGVIIAEGTKEELKGSIENQKKYSINLESAAGINEDDFFVIEGIQNVEIIENTVEITCLKNIENLDRIIGLLTDKNEKILNMTTEVASLETVFLKLTGRKLRD